MSQAGCKGLSNKAFAPANMLHLLLICVTPAALCICIRLFLLMLEHAIAIADVVAVVQNLYLLFLLLPVIGCIIYCMPVCTLMHNYQTSC